MVVTALIAEGGLVARVLDLPKAAQASAALAAETGGMLGLAGVGEVSGVAVTAEGVTIVLAPATEAAQQAVGLAMVGSGTAGGLRDEGCEDGAQWHHIATVENSKSTVRGGPWTPRLKKFFDRAGLSMENAANKVRIRGHRGPHPEEYHLIVYRELSIAVEDCNGEVACRAALTKALQRLAKQTATHGAELHRLVTRGCK
jgi:hypothetical protein